MLELSWENAFGWHTFDVVAAGKRDLAALLAVDHQVSEIEDSATWTVVVVSPNGTSEK